MARFTPTQTQTPSLPHSLTLSALSSFQFRSGSALGAPDPEDYIIHPEDTSDASDSDTDEEQWCWPALPKDRRQQVIMRRAVRLRRFPVPLPVAEDLCVRVLEGRALPPQCGAAASQHRIALKVTALHDDSGQPPLVLNDRVFVGTKCTPTAVTASAVTGGTGYYEVHHLRGAMKVGWRDQATKTAVTVPFEGPGRLGIGVDAREGPLCTQIFVFREGGPPQTLDSGLSGLEGVCPYAELQSPSAARFVFAEAEFWFRPEEFEAFGGGLLDTDRPQCTAGWVQGQSPASGAAECAGPTLDFAFGAELAQYINTALTLNPELQVADVPWNQQQLAKYPLLRQSLEDPPGIAVDGSSGTGPPKPGALLDETRNALVYINGPLSEALPFICSVEDPEEDRQRCPTYARVRAVAPLLLLPTKLELLQRPIGPQYTKLGPSVTVNRFHAADHTANPEADLSGASSVFGQLHAQLHTLPLHRFFALPPKARAFLVKFEGEGAVDWGGPYREVSAPPTPTSNPSCPSLSPSLPPSLPPSLLCSIFCCLLMPCSSFPRPLTVPSSGPFLGSLFLHLGTTSQPRPSRLVVGARCA